MVKDIFGDKKSKQPDIRKGNISDKTTSSKPLSEVLKGVRRIDDNKQLNVNTISGKGTLIILLDTSGSMMGKFDQSTKIKTANEVLISQLIPNMLDWEYGIITFGDVPRWYISPTQQKNALMIQPQAYGSTYMMIALRLAWDWVMHNKRDARLILISDGEPTDASKQTILEFVNQNRNIPIDTVGIGESQFLYSYDPTFLREISRLTGGMFCEAHTVRQLTSVIHELSPVERPLLGTGGR